MMKLRESINGKLKKRGGFTLIEMLLVVAIVAILVVISIPMMNSSLDEARKAADDANERAAKAEAAIVWLTEEEQKDFEKLYNAEKGILVDKGTTGLKAYGKYTKADENRDNQVVQVTVKDGVIETSWVDKP